MSDDLLNVQIHIKGPGSEPTRNIIPSLIPCSIEYNGPAPIDSYFNVVQQDDDDQHMSSGGDSMKSTFRGRSLTGEKVDLPDEMWGFVVEKSGRTTKATPSRKRNKSYTAMLQNGSDNANAVSTSLSSNTSECLHWRAPLVIDRSLIVYHRDGDVLSNDALVQSVTEWPGIAKALHSPIPVPNNE